MLSKNYKYNKSWNIHTDPRDPADLKQSYSGMFAGRDATIILKFSENRLFSATANYNGYSIDYCNTLKDEYVKAFTEKYGKANDSNAQWTRWQFPDSHLYVQAENHEYTSYWLTIVYSHLELYKKAQQKKKEGVLKDL